MCQEIALKLNNVKYAYSLDEGIFAVNGISLTVAKGEFLAVLGHNGSGKSTLARLMNGLIFADEGEIEVFGQPLSSKANVYEIRKRVGMVFQNPDNQMVASIVEDDVAFGPENIGIEREEIARRIDWALGVVGMLDFKKSSPTRLSGGQKQRIAIASTLAIKPDVLILDESTAMLDPKGRKEVMSVIKRLNEEEGITVILITHFLEEALLADRAIVMNKGEIVMDGTPDQIFARGDELETFNLRLPKITSIINELKKGGLPVENTLSTDELANQIIALKKGGFSIDGAPYLADEKVRETGGEWDVKIEDLTYTYSAKSPFKTDALTGVNLTVKQGEFFGIIGHTGSGKSTLVQHLNALIKLPQAQKKYRDKKVKKGATPPTMPKITVGKYDLSNKTTNFNDLRANVGMVFQYPEHQLFAESVYDDVAFGLKNFFSNLSSQEITDAVKESLTAVGLNFDEIKDKSPFELSGGQKRRVAIAGVIVTKPSILVLDEPAAGLDPAGKQEIISLLHTLHEKWCKTVIIVSHDMDEIAENCTSVAVMSAGKIVACDSPKNLFANDQILFDCGLDIPLTAKICKRLAENGIKIECDFTEKGLTTAILSAFEGGANA